MGGHGHAKDVNHTPVVDHGTLPRTNMPIPGTIGLDAHSSGAAHVSAPIAPQVVGYAQHHNGQKVGDGECFALADDALSGAHAKSASDFGTITDNADYVWGTPVSLADLKPGDIIQFRNYRYEREAKAVYPDGSWATDPSRIEVRPHHTAIVESVLPHGEVVVLEQNAPRHSPVHHTHLFFKTGSWPEGDKTVSVTVQGSVWFYRPQPK